jgi:hypothetical protein
MFVARDGREPAMRRMTNRRDLIMACGAEISLRISKPAQHKAGPVNETAIAVPGFLI